MNQTKQFFLLLFLFATRIVLLANNPQEDYLQNRVEQHRFDEQKWKSLTEGIDYSKDVQIKQAPEKKRQPGQGLTTLVKFLVIGTGLLLLIWLYLKMAAGNDLFSPKNKKLQPSATAVDLDRIEENLQEAELAGPIRQAVAEGNFALAIRLHYLAVLKELSSRKHIRWKQEKTNGEYLQELSGSNLQRPFREATNVFERIWYGKAPLGREDYFQLEKNFQQLLAIIE